MPQSLQLSLHIEDNGFIRLYAQVFLNQTALAPVVCTDMSR